MPNQRFDNLRQLNPAGGPIPVLLTHFGDDWLRGSEILLLDLMKALDKSRIHPILWCNSPLMADAARAAGHVVFRNTFQHAFDYTSPPASWSQFRRLRQTCRAICREHGIRVLHANSAAPAQWLVPSGLAERLPVLAHLHTSYLRRSRYVLLLHAVTLVVGVSKQPLAGLISDGMDPIRTKVIYNGIDLQRFSGAAADLRPRLGIPPDAFVIATLGSLIERKGQDLLIRAFSAMPHLAPEPHLLIGGEGPMRETWTALAAELKIADRVHFLGQVDDPAPLYKTADVFALASRNEAFGLVLAEAGSFGLACVGTLAGGVPEVVVHNETGLLVPTDNAKALSEALEKLRADNGLRRRLGEAARERICKLFTVQLMAREFEATYEALASLPPDQLSWSSALKNSRPYLNLLTGAGKRGRNAEIANNSNA